MLIPLNILSMHIPDGFLNIYVSVAAWFISLSLLVLALRRARSQFDERLVPLAGIMAAFIFAGQMINFPVTGGTSGHFIGATLAFIVLGPWLGMVAMSSVIILQALLFQDGGLVVMGANLLVMAIVPGFVGLSLYRLVWQRARRTRLIAAAGAAWLSIMAAAFVVALLLAFSGTSSFNVAVPAMLGVHALIGLGEALITASALGFILQTRPELLEMGRDTGRSQWLVVGGVVVLMVVLLTPFASGHPDGLVWVAGEKGFLSSAQSAPFSLLSNYTIPGLGSTSLARILAGLLGAVVVGVASFLISRAVTRRRAAMKQAEH